MKRTLKITGMLLIVVAMAGIASCGGGSGSNRPDVTKVSQSYDIPTYTPEELAEELNNCFKSGDGEKFLTLFVSVYDVLTGETYTDDEKKQMLSEAKKIYDEMLEKYSTLLVSLEYVGVERIDDCQSRLKTWVRLNDGSEGEFFWLIKKVNHGWRIVKLESTKQHK